MSTDPFYLDDATNRQHAGPQFDRFERQRSPHGRRERKYSGDRHYSPDRERDYDRDGGYHRPSRRRSLSPDDDRYHKRRRSLSPRYGHKDEHGGRDYHYERRDSRDGRRSHYYPTETQGVDGQPIDGNAIPHHRVGDGFGGMGWNGGAGPPNSRPKDPAKLDFLLNFREFAEYIEVSDGFKRSEDELSKRYTIYKENLVAKQAQSFFETHKEIEWFREKYHPVESKPIRQETLERRRVLLTEFMARMEEGKLDGVDFDEIPEIENASNAQEISSPDASDDTPLFRLWKEMNPDRLKRTIFIKTISPTLARQKVLDMCKNALGDRFDYLSLSDPNPLKKFYRHGWIVCREGTDMEKAFKDVEGKSVDNFTFHFAVHSRKEIIRPRITPEFASTEERLRHDLQRALRVADVLEKDLGGGCDGASRVTEFAETVIDRLRSAASVKPEGEPVVQVNADDGVKECVELKKRLDMIHAYLRQVHMFCYYCGLEADSSEELSRKCALHVRKKLTFNEIPTKDYNWGKNLDTKIDKKVMGPEWEVEKSGGKNLDIELDREAEKKIAHIAEQKYRCKICNKLFKGDDFVRKHIRTKHSDVLKEVEIEATFFNNYVRDPHHLIPSMQPPPNSNPGLPQHVLPTMPPPGPAMFVPGLSMVPGLPPVFPFQIAAAVAGTPHDQIPRLGFENLPDFTNRRRRESIPRRGSTDARSAEISNDRPPQPPEGTVLDPRSVRSYEDLDAPAAGGDIDSEISFF